jgi:predicted HTH transcriptional regulator
MNKLKSAKFDQEFVRELLKQNEGIKLDFKQKITSKDKIAKTLSALANSQGGFIVIGMSDKKEVVGIDVEEEQYMIEAANEEYCIPRVSLICDEIKVYNNKTSVDENEEEKSLLLVEVKKSPGPLIFCKNKSGELKAYHRVNDQTLAISI